MGVVLLLTTVHPRQDIRIFVKEARTLARHLSRRVVLAVADGEGDVDYGAGDVLVHDMGRIRGRRAKRALVGIARSLNAARSIRPDVVHLHDPELLPVGFVLKMMGMRVIYDVHEDFSELALSREWVPRAIRVPASWLVRAVEWAGAKLFDLVIVATPGIRERFRHTRTVMIQNYPIWSELIAAVPVPYAQRPSSVAYAGVISRVRSASEMVKAFAVLGDEHVRLHLAGPISSPVLETELRSDRGWEYVTYHGQLDRGSLAQLLGSVRAGLVVCHPLPNHVNSQPNKLFEYMSVGLPVIASDFPLWRSIIAREDCGILVDPQSPTAIADAVRWLLDNPAEAEAMGLRGQQAVERAYTWEMEAPRLTKAYDAVLAG